MVQVELSKIIIDEKRQDQIIVLREKDGERQIPIIIGFLEASSIDKMVASTFHAKLVLRTASDQVQEIDSRPSDGIALAVRAQAPVFVEEEVLDRASIPEAE